MSAHTELALCPTTADMALGAGRGGGPLTGAGGAVAGGDVDHRAVSEGLPATTAMMPLICGATGAGAGIGGAGDGSARDHHANLEQHYRERLAMFAATPPWGLDFSRRRPPSKLTR